MKSPDPHSVKMLDPGMKDPGYWPRFHRNVMERVSPELARRRARAELTVSGVVRSWARTVVPAALAAAAAALFLIALESTPGSVDLELAGIEELLVVELEDEPIPVVLSDEPGSGTAGDLAMERF